MAAPKNRDPQRDQPGLSPGELEELVRKELGTQTPSASTPRRPLPKEVQRDLDALLARIREGLPPEKAVDNTTEADDAS